MCANSGGVSLFKIIHFDQTKDGQMEQTFPGDPKTDETQFSQKTKDHAREPELRKSTLVKNENVNPVDAHLTSSAHSVLIRSAEPTWLGSAIDRIKNRGKKREDRLETEGKKMGLTEQQKTYYKYLVRYFTIEG